MRRSLNFLLSFSLEEQRSEGGKTQCVRQWISEKLSELQPQDDPTGKVDEVSSFLRSKHLLPKVPMATIAKWAREDVDEQLEAQVCVIQEPLKARVITKGDARAYYAVMPLQKDCWKHLAAKEEFSLIGRLLAEENLINIDQGRLVCQRKMISGSWPPRLWALTR